MSHMGNKYSSSLVVSIIYLLFLLPSHAMVFSCCVHFARNAISCVNDSMKSSLYAVVAKRITKTQIDGEIKIVSSLFVCYLNVRKRFKQIFMPIQRVQSGKNILSWYASHRKYLKSFRIQLSTYHDSINKHNFSVNTEIYALIWGTGVISKSDQMTCCTEASF